MRCSLQLTCFDLPWWGALLAPTFTGAPASTTNLTTNKNDYKAGNHCSKKTHKRSNKRDWPGNTNSWESERQQVEPEVKISQTHKAYHKEQHAIQAKIILLSFHYCNRSFRNFVVMVIQDFKYKIIIIFLLCPSPTISPITNYITHHLLYHPPPTISPTTYYITHHLIYHYLPLLY